MTSKMDRFTGWSGVWAFYLSNGSIERRKVLRHCTQKQVRALFPFERWHKVKVLKLVHVEEENQSDICPKNNHAHHLAELSRLCVFCGKVIERQEILGDKKDGKNR